MLWGARSAIRSGCTQALVYDELAAAGAPDAYLRLAGRGQAVSLVSMLVAIGLAAPVYRLGGYPLVGAVSVAVGLANAAVALALPERGRTAPVPVSGMAAYLGQLRTGLGEVRRRAVVRRGVLLMAAVAGLGATEEYVPLWTRDTGVPVGALPLLLLLPVAAMAAAGWWADRLTAGLTPKRFAAVVAVAATLLAAGAGSGHPAGMLAIAGYYGLWTVGALVVEARVQRAFEVSARATVLSVAGLGSEVGALVLFGAYGLGSLWWGSATLLAAFAVPTLLIAVAAPRWLPAAAPPA